MAVAAQLGVTAAAELGGVPVATFSVDVVNGVSNPGVTAATRGEGCSLPAESAASPPLVSRCDHKGRRCEKTNNNEI